ncbi:efflux RND transporter permease subunit [Shigella flexneri]
MGIAMVLSAVFVPIVSCSAVSLGRFSRQFSITIVSAMALLFWWHEFYPASCATLLKPVSAEHHENKGGFFGWFNTTLIVGVNHYTDSIGKILAVPQDDIY